jgi:hypothetical protein
MESIGIIKSASNLQCIYQLYWEFRCQSSELSCFTCNDLFFVIVMFSTVLFILRSAVVRSSRWKRRYQSECSRRVFLDKIHQVRSRENIWKPNSLKSLGARKPKGINRHLCLNNMRQAQPVWRMKSYNFKREEWEGNVLFLFKYFLKFFFNYLAGVISLWLMAVPFIWPTPLFRRESRRKRFLN